ncbi:hypothetical protein CPLU01_10870 [Colletotrichum plurivorum]|uniref:Uncharacterized protein n=1 Tax=Colletotrichum plurivorum TaxID=2175906 RepID=A0A8H6K3G6_9PEZI|nr:hypothetical protein CPLU01_10870 [Colletotrichum plurivorum]
MRAFATGVMGGTQRVNDAGRGRHLGKLSSISTTLTRSHQVIPTPAAVPISATCPEIWIGMEAWRDRIRGAVAPSERIIAGFLGTERILRQSKLPRGAVLQAVVQGRRAPSAIRGFAKQ